MFSRTKTKIIRIALFLSELLLYPIFLFAVNLFQKQIINGKVIFVAIFIGAAIHMLFSSLFTYRCSFCKKVLPLDSALQFCPHCGLKLLTKHSVKPRKMPKCKLNSEKTGLLQQFFQVFSYIVLIPFAIIVEDGIVYSSLIICMAISLLAKILANFIIPIFCYCEHCGTKVKPDVIGSYRSVRNKPSSDRTHYCIGCGKRIKN